MKKDRKQISSSVNDDYDDIHGYCSCMSKCLHFLISLACFIPEADEDEDEDDEDDDNDGIVSPSTTSTNKYATPLRTAGNCPTNDNSNGMRICSLGDSYTHVALMIRQVLL